MHWKRAAPLILVVCAIVGAAAPVFAQAVQTASLTGTVKDGSGAVLPGVTVNVSSPSQVGGVQTSVSDSQGIYRFPALRPGIYQMETTLAGFKGVRRDNITLPLGTTITVDITMAVASVSETVQVIGESPVIDIKSSASNTQLSEALLQNLPTGRFQPDVINLDPRYEQQRRLRRIAELERAADGWRRCQRPGGRDTVVVLQLQLGRAGANRRARRQRRVRRIHRRRRQQHHPLGQQQMDRTGRVPHRAQGLGCGQHDLALRGAAQDVQAARDRNLLGLSAQLGGPIIKDRLCFFSGFQYFDKADRPAGYTGDFTTEKDPRSMNKLNWSASPSVRVEGFFEADKFNVAGRGASARRPTTAVTALEPSPEMN